MTQFIDIEVQVNNQFPDVSKANEKIVAVTIFNLNTGTLHIICRTDMYQIDEIRQYRSNRLSMFAVNHVIFDQYDDETLLLQRVAKIIQDNTLLGHNIAAFDIPYFTKRYQRLVNKEFKLRVNILDTIDEYRRSEFYQHVSLTLKYIMETKEIQHLIQNQIPYQLNQTKGVFDLYSMNAILLFNLLQSKN